MQEYPHRYTVRADGRAEGEVLVSSDGLDDLKTTPPPEAAPTIVPEEDPVSEAEPEPVAEPEAIEPAPAPEPVMEPRSSPASTAILRASGLAATRSREPPETECSLDAGSDAALDAESEPCEGSDTEAPEGSASE